MKQAIAPERIIRECPACSADWDVLRGCLKRLPDKVYSPFTGKLTGYIENEDRAMARHIISGCPTCKSQFEG